MKKSGTPQKELDLAEYAYRFSSYQNLFYGLWKRMDWGNQENEALSKFAEIALQEAVREKGKLKN